MATTSANYGAKGAAPQDNIRRSISPHDNFGREALLRNDPHDCPAIDIYGQDMNESTNELPRILVIDDDISLQRMIASYLEEHNIRTDTARGQEDMTRQLAKGEPSLILLDLRLGQEDGFDVLEAVAKREPDVPVVILTAHGTIELAVDAMKRGAFGFVTKPFLDHDLLQKVESILKQKKKPDPAVVTLCEVITPLLLEVARLRAASARH